MDKQTIEFLTKNLTECRRALKNKTAVLITNEYCDIPVNERHSFYIERVRDLLTVAYLVYSSTDAYIQNAFYLADLQIGELITDEDFVALEKFNIKLHESEVEYERRRNSNG